LHRIALNAPLYSWQSRIARRLNNDDPWPDFNYVYVGLVWGAFVAWLAFWTPTTWIVALVAFWRLAEILTWYIKLLFDKGHRVFLEVERNLFFLIVDGLAFVTLLAFVLRRSDPGGVGDRWSAAFSAFTLNGSPDNYEGPWAWLVGLLGAVGGLALLAAGLGVVIGIISARIQDALEERRPYTGPTRPPFRPRRPVQ
jgi:hypothetical protein